MQTLMQIVAVVLYIALEFGSLLAHGSGSKQPERLSPSRMKALLKAWEDYEVGTNRSGKLPAQGPGRLTEPRDIVRFAAHLTLGIVVLCLVVGAFLGARSGRAEPL